jgi:serine/threonine protein kinase
VRTRDWTLEALITVRNEIIASASLSCKRVLGISHEELEGLCVFELLPRFSSDVGVRVLYCRNKAGSLFLVTAHVCENAINSVIVVLRRHQDAKMKHVSDNNTLTLTSSLGWYSMVENGELGKGSCGCVHLAVHRLSGEHVAVKTILKAEYQRLAMDYPPVEMVLLQQLKHENICQLYQIITTELAVHLVMEAVSWDLFNYAMEKGALPEDEVKVIFVQIVRGVGYMHSLGIVHRDLKLENILMTESKAIKLIDVGLGNFYDKSGAVLMDSFCGSPDYAAPEVLERKAYFGPGLDIWALGVILFILATSYLPFNTPVSIVEYNFKWPGKCQLSHRFRDLVSSIFKPATSRVSIDAICAHPWSTSLGEYPRWESTSKEFDQEIGGTMEREFGFKIEDVQNALENNLCNQLSATYHLLCKKKARV